MEETQVQAPAVVETKTEANAEIAKLNEKINEMRAQIDFLNTKTAILETQRAKSNDEPEELKGI